MAPKGHRHHPYRATAEIDTPGDPLSRSWYAGPGRQPGGDDHPPSRPILIIIDYSPLQALSHPSEINSASFRALHHHNFRYASTGEQESLFTWSQQFSAEMAAAVQIANLRTQICNRLRTQWEIRMIPSDLELCYADLDGDVFQVRNESTIMQVLEEYRPEWRIKQYNFAQSSPLVPGTPQPFIFRLTCHKVRQGVILP